MTGERPAETKMAAVPSAATGTSAEMDAVLLQATQKDLQPLPADTERNPAE